MRIEEVMVKVTRLLIRMGVSMEAAEEKEKCEERHECRQLAKRRVHATFMQLNFLSFSHLCLVQTIDLRAMSVSGEHLVPKIKEISASSRTGEQNSLEVNEAVRCHR